MTLFPYTTLFRSVLITHCETTFIQRTALIFYATQRAEIAKDVEFANKEIPEKKYPDVSKWPIKSYVIPKQGDR